MARSFLVPGIALAAGGVTAGIAAYFASRKADATVKAVEDAVQSPAPPTPSGTPAPDQVVALHTTGYWPFSAKDSEKKMEGGVEGAAVWRGKRAIDPQTGKRPYLHTLEQHLADPVKHPYVSLSGDPDVWPLGQRIIIDAWPTAVFRFVDTGGHFTGLGKVYRLASREPVDVCVDNSKTKVVANTSARVVRGDNWEKGAPIVASKLPSTVLGAGAPSCREALGRMLASERGRGTPEEMQAAAWVARNRAAKANVTVGQMLCPTGVYGPQDEERPFASTRKPATRQTDAVAAAVLAQPMSSDPTGGAVDFWDPSQHGRLKTLGDVYRKTGAPHLAAFSGYTSDEGEVRAEYLRRGLRVLSVVGDVELLG